MCPRHANSRDEASKRNGAIGGGYCGAHDVGSKLLAVIVDKLRQSLVRAKLTRILEARRHFADGPKAAVDATARKLGYGRISAITARRRRLLSQKSVDCDGAGVVIVAGC